MGSTPIHSNMNRTSSIPSDVHRYVTTCRVRDLPDVCDQMGMYWEDKFFTILFKEFPAEQLDQLCTIQVYDSHVLVQYLRHEHLFSNEIAYLKSPITGHVVRLKKKSLTI